MYLYLVTIINFNDLRIERPTFTMRMILVIINIILCLGIFMKCSAILVRSLGLLLASLVYVSQTMAGEANFGWIYTTDLTPAGKFELEHKSFLQKGQVKGDYTSIINSEEIEYGVTDNFQIAGYLNWSYANANRNNNVTGETGGPVTDVDPNTPFDRYRETRYESAALEMIYRLKNPLTDGYGLALYLEPEIGPRTRELEWRIILQKNFLDDRLIVAANIMGAHEREQSRAELERASVLDLTLGASYRFADNWSAGAEFRNHNEFIGYHFDRAEHSAFFFGPNVHYAAKDWWVTAAWRHQLPIVQTYDQEQRDITINHRIYGDEHAKNEFVVKVGVPF